MLARPAPGPLSQCAIRAPASCTGSPLLSDTRPQSLTRSGDGCVVSPSHLGPRSIPVFPERGSQALPVEERKVPAGSRGRRFSLGITALPEVSLPVDTVTPQSQASPGANSMPWALPWALGTGLFLCKC